jgi:integrase
MATIKQYQKKNGEKAWYFKTYLGVDPATGKKITTTRRGFRTQKEAKTALARLEVMSKDNKLTLESNYTFDQIKDMWLEQYQPTVKESTYLRVQFLFNKNISSYFGKKRIQSYNTVYCQEAINKWKEKYSTYKALKSYTSAVFDYAKKMNILTRNPMDDVSFSKGTAKETESKINFFEKHELQDFLSYCEKDAFPITYPFFRLLAFTGVRKGEALSLTWEDIDFKQKNLTINKTLIRNVEHKLIASSPKTTASYRTISIDDITLSVLKKWKIRQKEYLLIFGQKVKSESQPVFSSKGNQYIDFTRMNQVLNRITKTNNLPNITVHGFRHTHCSLLFEAGLSVKEVQERLGHSNISTTMNIYAHVTKTQKERSAEKFAAYVNF